MELKITPLYSAKIKRKKLNSRIRIPCTRWSQMLNGWTRGKGRGRGGGRGRGRNFDKSQQVEEDEEEQIQEIEGGREDQRERERQRARERKRERKEREGNIGYINRQEVHKTIFIGK